jgi:hypothetical protein
MEADRFLEVMDFEEGLAASARDRAARIEQFEERLAGFAKGFMNWTPAKRMAFLEEAGAETLTDFTVLFANIIDRMLLPKYKSQAPDFRQYVKIGANRDFRPSQGIGLWGMRGALDAKTNRGEYKERVINDGKIQIVVSPFGNRVTLGFENFINDDLGALSGAADDFVTAALRTEWREVTKLFAAATGPHTALFGTALAHPVDGVSINNKGTDDFSVDTLGSAIQKMRQQKDADGEPIIVTKFHLVVPPALEVAMYKALTSSAALIATGFGNSRAVETSANVVAINFSITGHVNPYLPIIDTSGNADKNWYLFADPGADGPAVQMNFLRGRETPEVLMKAPNKVSLAGAAMSAFEGDYEGDKVGIRVRHILGGTQVDPRYAYANVGA